MPPSVDAGRVVEFHEMGIDERIVKAIAHLGWKEPTAIQEQAIPFALQGRTLWGRHAVRLKQYCSCTVWAAKMNRFMVALAR